MFFKLCKWYQILQHTTFKISTWNSKFLQNKFPCHKSARKTKDMHTVSNLNPEAYSEPSQRSKMEYFFENHYRLKALNYFNKKLHFRCWTGFWMCLWNSAETKLIRVPSQRSKMEYFCENHYRLKALNYFSKKLHLRFLTGFWTCLWNSAETKLIGVRWTNASFTLFLRNIMKIHSMILSLFRIL